MDEKFNYQVNKFENIYFFIKVIISLIIYFGLAYLVYFAYDSENATLMRPLELLFFYIIGILMFFIVRNGVFVGYIKGNAVKISETQFPEINNIVIKQSKKFGLSKVPEVYILQSGGFINAFAAKFFATDYIILFSETVQTAFEHSNASLEFIIAHEMGHIIRNHPVKSLITLPSAIIPFLEFAYYRACEYTCDNIGYSVSPQGFKQGILILASGSYLFKNVKPEQFIRQKEENDGFWYWFSEKMATHPHLVNRLQAHFDEVKKIEEIEITRKVSEVKESDHSKYMPL